MIIIKNLFRTILILILFTIIAQSKESDKINKNEWVISLEQYFLNLGNIEGSFTQIDQIGNIKIISLEKALEDFPNTSIVVGSFEFLEQIEDSIAKALRERNLKNRVFSVKNLEE